MHNSVWKLTSLATVVGVALFFIVQAQKLMKPQTSAETTATTEQFDPDALPAEESADDEAEFASYRNTHGHASDESDADNSQADSSNMTEPDPFADETVSQPTLSKSSRSKVAAAGYRDTSSRNTLINEEDSVVPTARNSRTTGASPTLRLPASRVSVSEADDQSDASPFEEAPTKVGPRLALPGKSRPAPLEDDSAFNTHNSRETGIRQTSAEEEVPSIGDETETEIAEMNEADADDADFQAGKSRNTSTSLEDDSDMEEAGPTLLPTASDDAEPTTPSLGDSDEEFARLKSRRTPLALKAEPEASSEEEDPFENDAAEFVRNSRTTPSALDNSDEGLAEPTVGRTLTSRPQPSGLIDPEFPTADDPMPKARNADLMDDSETSPALSLPSSKAPRTLPDDDSELFPGAENPLPRKSAPLGRTLVDSEDSEFTEDAAQLSDAPVAGKPHLSIEKISPPSATLGEKMIYEIRVSNPSSVAARQVVLNDDVPEGVDLDGTIPRAELSGRRLIWRLGTLEPGAEKLVKVRVTPVRVGEVGSVATVNFLAEPEETRTVPANFQADGKRPLPRVPQLEIKSSLPDQVYLNQNFRVQLTITNVDRAPLQGIVLLAELDPTVRHTQVTDNRLECSVGDLQPGQSFDIDLDLVGIKTGMSVSRLTLLLGDRPIRDAEMSFRVLSRK